MALKSASLTSSMWCLAAMMLLTGCNSSNNSGQPKYNASHAPPEKFKPTADPPFKAKTHFAAGQLAESQGDSNRAIQQYWAAVKIDPKQQDALFRLGVLYCQAKE